VASIYLSRISVQPAHARLISLTVYGKRRFLLLAPTLIIAGASKVLLFCGATVFIGKP
jgi:hypothetical protein